jgi:hypothetical protein
MLRTASSLPLAGLLTLGSGPARFPAEPPACYRASWQLPGPDFHRQATTSLRTRRSTMAYVTVSPPALLGARTIEVKYLTVGDVLMFRVARGCDEGAHVTWIPSSAAHLVKAAYARDGHTAAVVLKPDEPSFRLTGTRNGRVVASVTVKLAS